MIENIIIVNLEPDKVSSLSESDILMYRDIVCHQNGLDDPTPSEKENCLKIVLKSIIQN
jgi:hypothetical protein